MKVYWIILVLLFLAASLTIRMRVERVKNKLKLKGTLVESFILGIAIGALIWFLNSEDIWTFVRLKAAALH